MNPAETATNDLRLQLAIPARLVASISLQLMTLARTIAGDRPRQSLSCNLLLTTLVVHV
ncbi:MAG TPA: hypothetical protein PKZ53_26620 [Acidobacteriota bacterium]|nr:hypothetical protein [Acidobacteriota bacterium]HNB71634.1 hypothetical protein [Acidobacteriota bacterium]HNG91861.1 hypothetical protein [Acidobacteriota bacterium]HNH82299.1 hypothetical protein [Acidobacteriota bacterium]HNJ44086.1 hypothetical protein [Acidobacteriota bacterium]